jgi:hypothetical protein
MPERSASLESWAELWRATEFPAALAAEDQAEAIRRRVRRGTLRMRLGLIAELAITIGVFAVVIRLVPPGRSGPSVLLWGFALIHTLIVWGFVLWNRRATWQSAALGTAACLALLTLRARRKIQAARFILTIVTVEAVALAVIAAVGAGELPWYSAFHWPVVALVLGAGVLAAAGMERVGRRALEELAELARDVESGAGPAEIG